MPTESPRIYVASLTDYNEGRLVGAWIDAAQDAGDIMEEVEEMLEAAGEGREEWAIHDYDGFCGIKLGESASFEDVSRLAGLVEKHGELFAGVLEHFGADYLDDAVSAIEENYRGEWKSLGDYAEEFVTECYGDAIKDLPSFIKYAIDYDAIGKDMETNGDIFTVEIGRMVHVFDRA
jgi:antirestriction protein